MIWLNNSTSFHHEFLKTFMFSSVSTFLETLTSRETNWSHKISCVPHSKNYAHDRTRCCPLSPFVSLYSLSFLNTCFTHKEPRKIAAKHLLLFCCYTSFELWLFALYKVFESITNSKDITTQVSTPTLARNHGRWRPSSPSELTTTLKHHQSYTEALTDSGVKPGF